MTYTTNRRKFLMQLGGVGAAAASAPTLYDLFNPFGRPFAWGVGESEVLPVGSPICVHISLDGGNDYLNTLAPVEDGWYRDATYGHGAIALTPETSLPLTGSAYRLHKNLPWLADRWNNNGDVGFVLGVGQPILNFSHFECQKFWETGQSNTFGTTGWLGRYADLTRPGNPLASVSIADLRPDSVGATAPVLVLSDTAQFNYASSWLDADKFAAATRKMATISSGGPLGDVAKMISTTYAVTDRIKGASDPALTKDSQYLQWVTQQLLQVAILVRAGMPCQTYSLTFGPFDSHSDQVAMQNQRFTELNEGLSKFFAALQGHARQNDVFVLLTSEFGRQVTANKDSGTDHGQAGMAVFIGGGARNGVYGQAPTLDPGGPTRPNRINDALRPLVDFRSVHATALNRLAKGDTGVADAVLKAHYEDLGVFGALQAPPTTTTTTAAPTTTSAPTTTTTMATTTTTMAPTTTTVKPTTTTTTAKPTTTTTTAPANKPPVASFTLNKTSGKAPLALTANGSASYDPDGTIKTWKWNWGDGGSSSGKSVSHVYLKKGTFAITLTVTDNKGAAASVTKYVTIS